MVKQFEHQACNLEAPSSSHALTASWICSQQSRVEILGHKQPTGSCHLLPVGILSYPFKPQYPHRNSPN